MSIDHLFMVQEDRAQLMIFLNIVMAQKSLAHIAKFHQIPALNFKKKT